MFYQIFTIGRAKLVPFLNLYEGVRDMHDFTLPANIKQIGSIGNGLRVYMEDYVCTFLHQYATSGGYEERIAYLVGRHMLIDGQSFLFVSGAIYGMYAEQMEGYTRFSQKSAEYAEAMLEEHFPGQEIVGWMQSQPSYGTYLNQFYGAYHLRQFTKPYQVLFVMDPLERVNAFYTVNPNAITPSDRMAEISGYFIYYEKNVNMHEYMLTNKSVDYTAKPPTFVELTPVEPSIPENEYDDGDSHQAHAMPLTFEDEFDERDTLYAMHGPRDTDPEDIIRRHQANSAKRRGVRVEQKRASSLLGGLCALLFVVSFVMGVGLVRNQDRIDRLEGEIRQLVTAHRNLFAQMSTPEFAPAFAEANPPAVPNNGEQGTAPATEARIETPTVPTQPPTLPQQQVYHPTLPPATQPITQPVTQPPTEPPTEPPTIPRTQPISDQEASIPTIPATYTIQPGDSLLGISLRFFGDANMVSEILLLNGIEDPDMIVAGRTIALPQR